MRVGGLGCRVFLLGSVTAVCLLAGTAQAARSSERGTHAAATSSHAASAAPTRVSASRGTAAEHDTGTRRGGGSKASHGGGMKSGGLPEQGATARTREAGIRPAMFGGGRLNFGKNSKARIYTGAYVGRYQGGYGVLQCVAFARSDTGIELSGNAVNWWGNAAGRYARGTSPEPGSILNFRATGNMRLGHVSVVSNVVGSREIQIDHAHWGGPGSNGGGVARGVTVVDVSPANDWSEVRVSLGARGEYGSTYPTYGFIYNRPEGGLRMAVARRIVPAQAADEDVAEAPLHSRATSLRHGDDSDVYDRNSQ